MFIVLSYSDYLNDATTSGERRAAVVVKNIQVQFEIHDRGMVGHDFDCGLIGMIGTLMKRRASVAVLCA